MGTAADLKNIVAETRPLVEQALDLTEQFAALRDAATEKGLDWSQIKALVKAQAQDERDGGTRVDRFIEKADFASSYADMLGLTPKMNEKNNSADALSETLAEARAVSARSTSANMAAQSKVSQALADAGMISQEAADETKAIAAGIARKFGSAPIDDLDIPPFLDRRASV